MASVLAPGCAAPAPASAPPSGTGSAATPAGPIAPPLTIPFTAREFAENPELLDRVAGTLFGFYRYIDAPFTQRVCAKYVASDEPLPQVNLHGDAHLEQYAVADDGRGLADFDSASVGPAIVDLLRFSTSLWIASDGRFSDAEADRAVSRFLDGYRAALADPNAVGPEPAAAARIRATFDKGPGAWLDHVEKFILPMSDEQRAHLVRSSQAYTDAMMTQNPGLSPGFFAIKRAGPLKMGIGSAHEKKFLARVEGPSPAPDDDVILETKQVVGRAMGSCVHGGEWGDALRVIVGQARLSPAPQRFLGHVELEGKTFYVHAWRVHYTELGARDVRSGDELAELAYDVGLQLGRGHPKQIADPHEEELRRALLAYVDKNDRAIHEGARSLAEDTRRAWLAFRRDAGR